MTLVLEKSVLQFIAVPPRDLKLSAVHVPSPQRKVQTVESSSDQGCRDQPRVSVDQVLPVVTSPIIGQDSCSVLERTTES